jgi:hypothetical protein
VFVNSLAANNIDGMGVQEARASTPGITTIANRAGEYHVATAPCNAKTELGCQLWIDADTRWMQDNVQSTVKKPDIAIMSSSPRHLLVKVTTKDNLCFFLVAHALRQAEISDEAPAGCWGDLHQQIAPTLQAGSDPSSGVL